ncbi:MAG: M15 family metallopeptidase [Nocardioides sp.]
MTDWRDVVLISDERVIWIPVVEAGDPLVDAGTVLPCTGESDVSRLVRAPVLERLVAADAALPDGYRIALNEGYRSPALQRTYFDRHSAHLRELDPVATDVEIHHRASRFISPPEVAPHTAGAAVDVLLTDAHGVVLDVGCPIDTDPEASGGRCYTAHPEVIGEQRWLRDLLSSALGGAGLVNYPTEWWHWSFGDRYWAMTTGAAHAHYGPVEPPAA